MAISAYVGLQGHGKSHGVVEYVILPALKAKRIVFTNIPMNQDLLEKDFGITVRQFTIDEIKENQNWFEEVFVSGAIFICDELWRLWPQGMRSTAANPKHLEFIAEHRHMVGEDGKSSEIIFATQDLGLVASFARQLIETTYRVEKLVKIGSTKKFRVDIYFGCVTGSCPPKSKLDRQMFGRYKPDVFKYYVSHTKSPDGVVGDETKTDNRSNALGGIMFKVVPVLMILIAWYAWSSFAEVKKAYTPATEVVKSDNTQNAVIKLDNKQSTFSNSKPKKPTFLGKSTSFSIVLSHGVFPKTQYKFRVDFDSSSAVFTYNDLTKLDYVLEPINDCTVLVTGSDYNGYVMCEKDDSKNWAESTFSTNKDST
jgi:zona occludens toxin